MQAEKNILTTREKLPGVFTGTMMIMMIVLLAIGVSHSHAENVTEQWETLSPA